MMSLSFLQKSRFYPSSYRGDARLKPMIWWLFMMAGLVGLMVMIGGITRLTNSGLSMVEWRVFMGLLPPLTEAEWVRVFGLYQVSPEFRYVHFDMDLSGFKRIFFWEYVHRLWGRLLGVAFIVPFILFGVRRVIPAGYYLPLFGLLGLGLLQAILGWWMVQSGLVDDPTVSPYRLASHLTLALIIYGGLLWLALSMLYQCSCLPSGLALAAIICLSLTIIAGGFVAGLDAGRLYNEYPLMGSGFVPIEYGEKGLFDPFENPASAQFHHRWLAVVAVMVIIVLGIKAMREGWFMAGSVMIMLVCGQFLIGLTALLLGVPIWAGICHQIGAVLLLGSVVVTSFLLGLDKKF